MDTELLQRVVEAGGQLLRVQRYIDRRARDPCLVPGLLLTFDVGRILIFTDAQTKALRFMHLQDIGEIEQLAGDGELAVLDEEEPWWRIIGSPLARIQPRCGPAGVRLQFRYDDRNPRFIDLSVEGSLIHIERGDQ